MFLLFNQKRSDPTVNMPRQKRRYVPKVKGAHRWNQTCQMYCGFSDRICVQVAMNAPSAESIAIAYSHAVGNVRPEAYRAVGLGSAIGSATGETKVR